MIQIDMPMPKCCDECPFADATFHNGIISLYCITPTARSMYAPDLIHRKDRPEWCPLKEQEAIEPTFKQDNDGIFVWACGSCGAYMYHIYEGIDKAKEYAKYCRQCGRPVKWE